MEAIKEHIGLTRDHTTDDGIFTLTEVECLGACVNGMDSFLEEQARITAHTVLDYNAQKDKHIRSWLTMKSSS